MKKRFELKTFSLQTALFVLFFVPPLAVQPWRLDGTWILTNYREPKLAAIQILSWLFLTVFWWIALGDAALRSRLRALLTDRWTWFLGVFLGYLCLTASQAMVPEAAFYELVQFGTLANLYIALSVLFQKDGPFRTAVLATTLSFAIVAAVGFYQLWRPIPFLIPIPGPPNPSTFGYKNPAALAILAQIFLVLAFAVRQAGEGRPRQAAALGVLVLLEIAYMTTLQSRTSYFALIGTALTVSCLALFSKKAPGKSFRYLAPIILGVVLIFGAYVVSYPPATERLKATLVYVKDPGRFMTSDRGTYLRNSVHMAGENIFGVGIGNWGFAYPVYRHFQPDMYFNEHFQVRRAHGDYAQMLGEAGWPGLMLWLALLAWALARGTAAAWHSRRAWHLLVVAQLLCFLLIMLFDYCIEMPYHKFGFFTVLAMVGAIHATGRPEREKTAAGYAAARPA